MWEKWKVVLGNLRIFFLFSTFLPHQENPFRQVLVTCSVEGCGQVSGVVSKPVLLIVVFVWARICHLSVRCVFLSVELVCVGKVMSGSLVESRRQVFSFAGQAMLCQSVCAAGKALTTHLQVRLRPSTCLDFQVNAHGWRGDTIVANEQRTGAAMCAKKV